MKEINFPNNRKTYLAIITNSFRLLCGYLLFSCSNKQILERVKIPEKGNFILVSGKVEPEEYYTPIETLILNPKDKELSILDLKESKNIFQVKDISLFYREYIFMKDNTKYLLLPDESKKNHKENNTLFLLPKLNKKKDKYIYPLKKGFGVYNIYGKLIKSFDIQYKAIDWMEDKIIYLERTEKNANNSIYSLNLETGKTHLIYKPDFYISTFQLSQDNKKLATIEYNSPWNPIEYSVKIFDLIEKRILVNKIMPNFTKSIQWSKNGSLGILYKLKEEEGMFSPFSIYFLNTKESYDLLNLPVYEPPGFLFSGKGYTGVTDFTWSPDGNEIAYISSESGNCNRDEGGNAHCALDVFTVNITSKKIEKLTYLKNKSLHFIDWIEISK